MKKNLVKKVAACVTALMMAASFAACGAGGATGTEAEGLTGTLALAGSTSKLKLLNLSIIQRYCRCEIRGCRSK